MRKLNVSRKLLVASVGVAAVNYMVACDKPPTSGNLPAPQIVDAAPPPVPSNIPPTSGNLPAPPPPSATIAPPTSGNLPAPPPATAPTLPPLSPKATASAKPPSVPKD